LHVPPEGDDLPDVAIGWEDVADVENRAAAQGRGDAVAESRKGRGDGGVGGGGVKQPLGEGAFWCLTLDS
jgi:hypothetical protein